METNRDDFVIAVRSAFLKKGNKQRFSLIGLIFFSIIILILGRLNFKAIDYVKISLKEIVYRSSYIVSGPENYFKNTYKNIQDHFKFYNEYKSIKLELKNLKAENIENNFNLLENKRLKKIIDDTDIESEDLIAKVLIDNDSPYLRSIVLNKGSKDNVTLGMAALNDNYLIGKVVEVNYSTSRVLLLSDINSKIPILIEPGGIQSILTGTGKNFGLIQYIKNDYPINVGNIIYTSGAGNIFKAGIPIGIIEELEIKNIQVDENLQKKIKFFSDFSQLKFVKIMNLKRKK